MDTVTIGRMRTRYRLPARGADGLRTRLDAVRTELLEGALEAALDQAGTRDGEEICIRRLHVPVRLRGVRGDSALAADWAAAIASALTQTLSRDGGDQAVRYGSRMHAWTDCALGVARGDLGRAWAWRQLGLWRGSGALSPAGAAAELVRGLAFAPQAVVPALVGLAQQGALAGLARQLDSASWTLLAAVALDVHEAPRRLLETTPALARDTESVSDRPTTDSGESAARDPNWSADGQVAPTAGAAASRPGAGSPLLALREVAAPENARAIAVLILLAADPALGRQGLAQANVQVASLVRSLLETPDRPAPTEAQRPRSARSPERAERPASAADTASGSGPSDPRGSAPEPVADSPDRPASTTGEPRLDDGSQARSLAADPAPGPTDRTPDTGTPPTGTGPAPATRSAAPSPDPSLAAESLTSERAPDPGPTYGLRKQGRTDWGGLLLLLNVLEPAGVLDPDAALPPGRTLRWALHRLAQSLVPVSPDDPAALAFAGLAPGSRPPSQGEPDASEVEIAAIAHLRARVSAHLHAVLNAGDESRESVLTRICRQPAEILADPGWIEVRFPLDTLSTQVRQAGLDLNPDWLPWLGAVVRLVYE